MNPRHLCFVAAALVAVATSTSNAVDASADRRHPDGPVCPSYRANDQYAIRLCDKGDDVKSIQASLRTAGYPVSIDGYFGPGTNRAVRAFQDDNGLRVDGLVGPRTWRALDTSLHSTGSDTDGSGLVDPDESTYTAAPPPSARCGRYVAAAELPLNRCDRGTAVRVAQLFLAELYAPLTIDGDFGPETETAVRNYQSEFGLTVDGVIGAHTWRQLTDGLVCGDDSDDSGSIDPGEVDLPFEYELVGVFLHQCTDPTTEG